MHPSTGPDIISDVRALFAFLSSSSFSSTHLPPGVELDPERLAVIGMSGGGYAARAAALYAEPKPRAVYLLYAMGGNLLSDYWLRVKSTEETLGPGDTESGGDALKHLLEHDPAPTTEAPCIGAQGTYDASGRIRLFGWFWSKGELLDRILGSPVSAHLRTLPKDARLAAVPAHLRPALLQIGREFPPTFLLHGGADAVVPVEESRVTYERLKEVGVEVEMEVIEGAPHGLFASRTPLRFVEGAEEAQERGMQFVVRFLGGSAGRP